MLDSREYRVERRVRVWWPAMATWADLSNLGGNGSTEPGFDFVKGVDWGETIDDPGPTATLTLLTNVESLSLSPFLSRSRLNRKNEAQPNEVAGEFAPLLTLAAEVLVETRMVADSQRTTPTFPVWDEVFRGFIDDIDPGPTTTVIQLRGIHARLQDEQIRYERVYAFAQGAEATKGLRVWEANTSYTVGELVSPTESKITVGKFYKVTSVGLAGKSGATEPAWPTAGSVTSGDVQFTVAGSTSTTAGTAVETVMQQIAADTLGASAPTLQVPTPSGWAIRFFLQSRDKALDAMRVLAAQRGWDLRPKFNTVAGRTLLTFYRPDRQNTASPAWVFGPNNYTRITRLKISIVGIRNRIRIYYSNRDNRDASGVPRRDHVEASDGPSIAKYGERYMEISEAATSHLDTQAEAQRMADAARDDLGEPDAEQEVALPYFGFAELGDLYQFSPNGRQYDDPQLLAVVAYRHSIADGKRSTLLTCRGKPAGAFKLWHRLSSYPGNGENGQQVQMNTPLGIILTIATMVGGACFTVSAAQAKGSTYSGAEVHVGKTANFTPDSATLKGSGDTTRVEVADLKPGGVYYARAVPYGESNGQRIRGTPTDAVAFTAGYVTPDAMQPQIAWGALPPNPDFEAHSDPDAPPDTWAFDGTWKTDATSDTSTSYSGTRSIAFLGSGDTSKRLKSQIFAVRGGEEYILTAFHRQSGLTNFALIAQIEWMGRDFSSVGVSTVNIGAAALQTNRWYQTVFRAAAPGGSGSTITGATAAYGRLSIGRLDPAAGTVWLDSVDLLRLPAPGAWQEVPVGNFRNGYYSYPATSDYEPAAGHFSTDGEMMMRGIIASPNGVTVPAFETVFYLPSGITPPKKKRIFACASSLANGTIMLEVMPSGQVISYVAVPQNTFISLEGIRYRP
jgi:hypothetical protein